jgi:hypothetical protein
MRNQGNNKNSNPFALLQSPSPNSKSNTNTKLQNNSREKELLEREIRLNRVYVVQDIDKLAGRRNKKNGLMPVDEQAQEEDPTFQTVKKKVIVKKVIEKNQGIFVLFSFLVLTLRPHDWNGDLGSTAHSTHLLLSDCHRFRQRD